MIQTGANFASCMLRRIIHIMSTHIPGKTLDIVVSRRDDGPKLLRKLDIGPGVWGLRRPGLLRQQGPEKLDVFSGGMVPREILGHCTTDSGRPC